MEHFVTAIRLCCELKQLRCSNQPSLFKSNWLRQCHPPSSSKYPKCICRQPPRVKPTWQPVDATKINYAQLPLTSKGEAYAYRQTPPTVRPTIYASPVHYDAAARVCSYARISSSHHIAQYHANVASHTSTSFLVCFLACQRSQATLARPLSLTSLE